jgi:benzoylformate decarboxylase
VNLHVAGLGNAVGMIYGALPTATRRWVVTAGQRDTRRKLRDPVLGHDLAASPRRSPSRGDAGQRADELSRSCWRAASRSPAEKRRRTVFGKHLPEDRRGAGANRLRPADARERFCPGRSPRSASIEAMAKLIAAARSPPIVAGDGTSRDASADEL